MAFNMKGSPMARNYGAPFKKHKPGHGKEYTKEVTLEKRTMYPGDATFKGSETSDPDQSLNSYGGGGATHYPEGHGSQNKDTVKKKRKTTSVTTGRAGNTTKTVKRKSGREKVFKTDEAGNTTKTVRDRKGNLKVDGKSVKSTERRTGHSKKDKKALEGVEKTYKPGGSHLQY